MTHRLEASLVSQNAREIRRRSLQRDTYVVVFELKPGNSRRSRRRAQFEAKRTAIRSRRLRILVIDDIQGTAESIAAWLKDEFHAEAKYVCSGPEAIADVAANVYNCILLDLMMDDMDGVETALRLGSSVQKERIVMMSADSYSSLWEKAGTLGFKRIPKPVTEQAEDLADILDRC